MVNLDFRYKTHDEQRAERRNYYSEREIPVSAPQAPPRSKKKRQSFREFREENKTQELFQSEHQTEDGSALLPINKIIAFDCPADGAASEDDIFVGLKGKILTYIHSGSNTKYLLSHFSDINFVKATILLKKLKKH